jgi:hypothetical protein
MTSLRALSTLVVLIAMVAMPATNLGRLEIVPDGGVDRLFAMVGPSATR